MATDGGHGISEKELTCAICTEILYQPLTLLDCLHTFCGACLKEWFKWQASSASAQPPTRNRSATSPYTCPSCRESVRRTKADWRLTTLLEGFLKANRGKVKSEVEKEELAQLYKPGEDVLVPVRRGVAEEEGEDERVLAQVREFSVADAERETARRRAERAAARGHRQTSGEARLHHHHSRSSRPVHQHVVLDESSLADQHANGPQIEHQPSLRDLLSTADDSQDVQADILRSIYADGLLEGIDLDNLTTEQEEELTERIAQAYRRRQRVRNGTNDRARPRREATPPRAPQVAVDAVTPSATDGGVSASQQTPPRARSPVLRPNVTGLTVQRPPRNQRRSRSSASQISNAAETLNDATPPAARSAIDLSQQSTMSSSDTDAPARLITASRSVCDPEGLTLRERHPQSAPQLNEGSTVTTDTAARPDSSGNRANGATTRHTFPRAYDTPPYPTSDFSPRLSSPRTLHHEISTAAFAPELATILPNHQSAPSIRCSRCDKPEIQHELHYNCRQCQKGDFNLCLTCYRNGRGCERWFGFGFRAFDRWARENKGAPQNRPLGRDGPHILSARMYIQPQDHPAGAPQPQPLLQEGAFCESCLAFADDGYWYCNLCLEGAWGFCSICVKQGRHCTHPLQAVAHLNTVRGGHTDPTKLFFVALPHLRQDCYVALPPGKTECELCTYPILPQTARYHCYQCQEGDYDVCSECYVNLVAHGKISQINGPSGWRRCVKGHRMAIVDFQSTGTGAQVRRTVRDIVGGWGSEDNAAPQRPKSSTEERCLALYSYFPSESVTDELAFPKNAEIRDVEDKNGDWGTGGYAGRFGLFPMNHVRML